MEKPPAFTWNDVVTAIDGAPVPLRPGQPAWVVGMSAPQNRSGSFLAAYPDGYVFTIEFEDGSAVEAPERLLRPANVS